MNQMRVFVVISEGCGYNTETTLEKAFFNENDAVAFANEQNEKWSNRWYHSIVEMEVC